MERRTGRAQKQAGETGEDWLEAKPGTQFAIGDAFRTGKQSKARVELRAGGKLSLGSKSAIRFLRHGGTMTRSRVRVETGGAEIVGGRNGVLLETEIGLARIEQGARVRVRRDQDSSMHLEIRVGGAVLERRGASDLNLSKGDSASIENKRLSVTRARSMSSSQEADEGSSPEAGVRLSVDGEGVKAQTSKETQWRVLAAGDHPLVEQTALRVVRSSKVTVTRGAGRVLVDGTARLQVGVEGDAFLKLRQGNAVASTPQEVLRVPVPGAVVLTGGAMPSRAHIIVSKSGTAEVEVQEGVARVMAQGKTIALSKGDYVRISAKGALLKQFRVPKEADIRIPAGERVTLHVRDAPIAVKIDFNKHCRRGSVEAPTHGNSFRSGFHTVTGSGAAVLLAEAGSTPYRVRCESGGGEEGEVVSRGTVFVKKDPGRAVVPTSQARNALDADGRNYTIVYQNRIPSVVFRWPSAPSATTYLFQINGPSGEKEYVTDKPAYAVPGSQLREGRYEWWFEASNVERPSSRRTRLRIDYDNASPSAQILQPAGAVAPGTVNVSGVALEGSTVQVGGKEVPLGRDHRFDTTATAPTNEKVLAIRISHPKRGVDYYVRRVASGQ